jgi:pimeloyl-ACP methyl ester carboxylesterase
MVAALRGFLAAHPFHDVVLVGHSGGGTLAWLMATQVPETSAVVTAAANLDIDLWARLHGYSLLAGSQNPALMPPLPARIREVHYAGGRDRNVPPAVLESFAAGHPAARIVVIGDYDHECCWVARWPQLLAEAIGDPPTAVRSAH